MFELLVVVALVALNGFFAMAEMALVRARRARLQADAEDGRKGAALALKLQENPSRLLSTVQIGITLVGIVAGAYGGATLSRYVEAWLVPLVGEYANVLSYGIVIAGITWLSLVAGELVPKRLALQFAERIAAFVAGPMQLLGKVAAPVVWLLEYSTNTVLRLMRLPPDVREAPTEEEVALLIAESRAAGVIEDEAGSMMQGLLRIADLPVRAIMTPRVEVVSFRASMPLREAMAVMANAERSRFPVLGEDEEVIGIVQTKDLVGTVPNDRPIGTGIRLFQPPVVPDTIDAARLVRLFKDAPVHLAVVVDEYGAFEGIVTPSDLLEAIAGDIAEAGAEDAYEAHRREDGSWLVDGLMPIHDVEHRIGVEGLLKHNETYQRLAGFVLSQLGRIPNAGDWFTWQDWRFEVIDMDGRRIDKVLITPPLHPVGGEMAELG
ncbi:hemolysin family protein [Geminicoccus roseus]|uniref:hemolysin family protein n=1 Tax=Geminicoccus roseus TaxID=404900 RepID=UPI0004261EB3|nr:hemolysin family protein [Geminicoccus roseus]